MLTLKLTEAEVQAALRELGLDGNPTARQRAVDHLVRQRLAPPPFKRRAVLQATNPSGKFRWGNNKG